MGIQPTFEAMAGFFAHCPEVFFIANLNGSILFRNDVAADTFGSAARETAPLAEIVHPQDRSAFDGAWTRVATGTEPARFQCRLRDADGLYRAFMCSARRAPERGEVYATCHPMAADPAPAPDVNNAPAASLPAPDTSLVEQQKILRCILDNLPICVWAFDQEGTYTFNDGKGLEANQIKPGQLVGLNAFKIHPEVDKASSEFRRALAGEVLHNIFEAYGMYWENWFLPVRDESGEVTGVVGASLDVTDAKRIENELLAKLDLIEKQQAVIHDMGAPIIEVWDRVLTLPLMGIVDSTRVATVMESLLAKVVQSGARYAILDLTGVDTVDTATATHMLEIIRAIRLLGAEGIITGIRPSVAESMVTLGLDLSSITTLANLRQGLKLCMQRMKSSA